MAFYDSFYKKTWNGNDSLVKELSINQAYQVQDLVTAKRKEVGEQVVGFKVGCTSKAIREQFGLSEPIKGNLFHPNIFDTKEEFDCGHYLNCAIEPEMVLKISEDLQGKDLEDEQLIQAIEYVSPGIEIHEFNFWIKPPTIQELICSGGIHTGLIIGRQKISPHNLNFLEEEFRVYKDNSLVTAGLASEIMGGPLHSLRWLVNSLTEKDASLMAGSYVIPGSPVELVEIDQHVDLRVEIDKLGSVSTYFRSS